MFYDKLDDFDYNSMTEAEAGAEGAAVGHCGWFELCGEGC